MRRIILASHHNFAVGLKDTLEFLSGNSNVSAINAYCDERSLQEQIDDVFSKFDEEDEIIIFSDMLGGSVNQSLFSKTNETTFLICGMNLPLVLAVAMISDESLEKDKINNIIEEAKQQIILMNDYNVTNNEEDE